MRINFLDRIVAEFSPKAGVKRVSARQAFDAMDKVAKRSANSGYDGAGTGRRSAHWRPRGTSADVEIALAGRRLRDRARDLARNTPHGSEAVQVWVDYLVGAGIEPRAKTGDDALDKKINDLWKAWSAQCDVSGPDGFNAQTALSVRGMVEGGDVFVRRRPRRLSDGLAVPLQLQLMEGDHLDESKTTGRLANGGRIVRGIEYDAIGRRAAYWLYRDHPGEAGLYLTSMESTRVPAEDVIHLFRKDRVQARGVTWLAPIVQKMRDDDDWTEAELVRKKIEACTVAFVTDADAGDEPITPAAGADDGFTGATDANGNPVETFEPGLIAYLRGGKSVTFNDQKSASGVSEWDKVIAHKIAEGVGIPYELLTGDLSQVNYSSIRTGLVKYKRRVDRLQWQLIIPRLCQPVWDWFILAAYDAGLIEVPKAAVSWTPPAFEEVDRTKEALADLMEMRAGTLSLPEAIARKGLNPVEHLNEIAEYNKLIDNLELILDSDPRKVSRAGLTQARPAGSELPKPDGETSED